jgi:lipopolysaccharide exporter
MSEQSLSRRVGISSLWTVGTRITMQLFSLVSMVLLSRWLGPAQMGLFEKTAIILAVLDMLSALGLETALLRRETLERKHYDTAWTLNIFRGAVMVVLLLLLSFKADSWFQTPGLGAILPWIALLPLLTGFENIGMIDVRRDLNFKIEYQWMIGRRIASFIIAIALAWIYKSVWALVCASVGSSIVGLVLSYALSPYRPRFSLQGWPDLRNFVGWFFSYTTLGAITSRIDELLLLRFASTTNTAFYRRAIELSGLPTTELAGPLARALLPGLAQLQSKPDDLRALFTKFLALSVIISLPVCVGMYVLAFPFVALLLGQEWISTAPLLQILCLTGLFRVYGTAAEAGFLALGRLDCAMKVTTFSALTRTPMLIYGIFSHGVRGLAIAFVISVFMSFLVSVYYNRLIGTLRLREVWHSLWRCLVASGAMMIVVVFIMQGYGYLSAAMMLLLAVTAGAIVYVAVLIILWHLSGKPQGAEDMILGQLYARVCYILNTAGK